jgi:hypothetical protein
VGCERNDAAARSAASSMEQRSRASVGMADEERLFDVHRP